MLKKRISTFFLLSGLFFSSILAELPGLIDFSQFHSIDKGYYNHYDALEWRMGAYAFNYAPELTSFFAMLRKTYQIDEAVETGTFCGGTTVVFSSLFKNVHTIEIEPNNFAASKAALEPYKNVQCHDGNSSDVLKEILPSLKGKRVLFYLDAHWQNYWPLLDELEEISRTHHNQCIIVIDDFKVPGRPEIPYDAYAQHECSYEYISQKLIKVFTDYTIHFLVPKSIYSRAKLVIIPKQWAEK